MVTIKEIAAEAGLPVPTVARILRGDNKEVWASAKQRADQVRKVAKRLGYRPNAAAKAMSKGRFDAITLVLSTGPIGNSKLPENMLRGIVDGLDQHNVHLTIANLSDEQLTGPGNIPKLLRESMTDGLLLNYNKEYPDCLVGLLEDSEVPWVWLNCKRECDAVYPDDIAAGRLAAQHLLECGHERIAYVSQSYLHGVSHYSETDRREGFLDVAKAAGVEARVFDQYDFPECRGNRLAQARALLSQPRRPTGIATYGGTTTSPLLLAAAQLGLDVPADLAIVSFGGERDLIGVTITTVLVPEAEVGRCAADLLIRRIRTGRSQPSVALPPTVVAQGNTTRKLRKSESRRS